MKQNNLKKGDRVRVYGVNGSDVCSVVAIDEHKVKINLPPLSSPIWVHYRNCFKIKPKKKLREFWCIFDEDDQTISEGYLTKEEAEQELRDYRLAAKTTLIKVREVRDD